MTGTPAQLFGELLDHAKLDGGLSIDPQPEDPRDAPVHMIDLNRPMAEQKRLSLRVEMDPTLAERRLA